MIIFDIIVAVAPISGYYSQLNLIKQQKSLGTFSIDVCAILMISGILRIFFWFAEGYAINLLFQAIFIIAIQVFNRLFRAYFWRNVFNCLPDLKILISHNLFGDGILSINTVLISLNIVRFLFGLAAITTILTLISQTLSLPLFGPFLGFISMSIESTLGIPQMLSNIRTKSVKGLSMFMIFTWFAGDLFKTIYFIAEVSFV